MAARCRFHRKTRTGPAAEKGLQTLRARPWFATVAPACYLLAPHALLAQPMALPVPDALPPAPH